MYGDSNRILWRTKYLYVRDITEVSFLAQNLNFQKCCYIVDSATPINYPPWAAKFYACTSLISVVCCLIPNKRCLKCSKTFLSSIFHATYAYCFQGISPASL